MLISYCEERKWTHLTKHSTTSFWNENLMQTGNTLVIFDAKRDITKARWTATVCSPATAYVLGCQRGFRVLRNPILILLVMKARKYRRNQLSRWPLRHLVYRYLQRLTGANGLWSDIFHSSLVAVTCFTTSCLCLLPRLGVLFPSVWVAFFCRITSVSLLPITITSRFSTTSFVLFIRKRLFWWTSLMVYSSNTFLLNEAL